MVLYGVAALALCMLAGTLLGELLGVALGIDANVGGVGFAMIVLSLIVSIYYNVIMAYSIIYVGVSFRGITDPEVIVLVLSM